MPEFTSHAPGSPCWVDLMSPSIDASKDFYAALFGWEIQDDFDDKGNRIYATCRKDSKQVAGIGGERPEMEGMPAIWNTYIAVEDIADTTAKVEKAGGSVIMPEMQVMSAGAMAVFADPTGAAFSVWKQQDHFGVELGNESDTYSWNELQTRDLETAKTFYAEVFGWSYDVMPTEMGDYLVVSGGKEGWAGLMTMPAEIPDVVPNHWGVYFSVEDVNASIAKVKDAGGQIVNGPMPLPGIGTMAVIHDPQGGSFSLMQPQAS